MEIARNADKSSVCASEEVGWGCASHDWSCEYG
jgi:hypothetical protein